MKLAASLLIFTRLIPSTPLAICRKLSTLIRSSDKTGIKYRIRPATFEDIPKIHQCNVENLPEHYNTVFYTNHILRWPDLSLIAETEERDLMGYALGRIETAPTDQLPFDRYGPSKYIGHVASVAVHQNYRGNGVAKNLVAKLHEEFGSTYLVNESSLYCRASNVAALNMYTKGFKYSCDRVFSQYYDDREDAFYLTVKGLLKQSKAYKEEYYEEDVHKTQSSSFLSQQ